MARTEVISSFLLVCSFGVVLCEPVRPKYGPPPKEETEVEIQQVEVYEVPWVGDQQPQNTYGPPNPQYGPPAPSYGPPPQEYGPPSEPTTTNYPSITTTLSPVNTTNSTVNSTNSTQNRTEKLQASSGLISRGHYYIYHPSGQLQKINYLTNDDSGNMEFSAKLQYTNIEPVRGPIYTYDPNTYVFSRINRK